MQSQKIKHTVIISIIVLVVVSLLATTFVLFLANRDRVSMIDVSKQRPSQNILIAGATLYAEGFISVYTYSEGVVGKLVGTSEYLEVGEHKKIRIPLTVAPERNMELIAILHKDDGDEVFNEKTDKVARNAETGDVMKEFILQF